VPKGRGSGSLVALKKVYFIKNFFSFLDDENTIIYSCDEMGIGCYNTFEIFIILGT